MSSSRGTSSSRRRSHGSKGKRRASASAEYDNILLVGDAGVGKSCILNSLYGEAVFASGLAPARVTADSTAKVDASTGRRYIDAPGLMDVSDPKGNAVQLEKAFKYPGRYYVLIVFTLEDGHVKHSQLQTMKRVIRAFGLQPRQCGVIFNKVPHYTVDRVKGWVTDGTYVKVIADGTGWKLPVSQFHLVPLVPAKIDFLPLKAVNELTRFIKDLTGSRVKQQTKLSVDDSAAKREVERRIHEQQEMQRKQKEEMEREAARRQAQIDRERRERERLEREERLQELQLRRLLMKARERRGMVPEEVLVIIRTPHGDELGTRLQWHRVVFCGGCGEPHASEECILWE